MSPRILLFLLFILSFSSCGKKKVSHSFYYWKTSYRADSTAEKKMKELGTDHFYIRYFDVDWSENLEMAVPKAEFHLSWYYWPSNNVLMDSNYTPVIYITNRVFKHVSQGECDSLAVRVYRKVARMTDELNDFRMRSFVKSCHVPYDSDYERAMDSLKLLAKAHIEKLCKEIQIDCDWTADTKDRYFYFLKSLRECFADKTISATIRLYPYKYPVKMGVPPVDRGMLMCYNIGGIKDAKTENSVFSYNELKKYISSKDYPLPLDVSFPVFGWYAWFRSGKYKGIVHDGLEPADLTSILQQEQDNKFRILKDTVINSNYFREGDILRMEFPEQKELQDAVELVTKKVSGIERIAFYHWGAPSTLKYESVIQSTFERY